MCKAMGIYDYMNHFWFENENDPCSLSEGVLYFYLLYEANRQHWASPFKVSTQMLDKAEHAHPLHNGDYPPNLG